MKNTPDFNPEDNEENIQDRLKAELIRPARSLSGSELWPYSDGAKGLLMQVSSATDTLMYRALSLAFILTKRTEKTFKEDSAKHVCGLAWEDINAWRAEVTIDFRNSLSDEAKGKALEIYNEYIELEKISEVTPVGTGARSMLKKKPATSLVTRSGKASRSRKKRA